MFGGHGHSTCEDVFSMPSSFERPQDQRVIWAYGWEPHMVSKWFLVVEKEDSRCSRLNTPLQFISKGHCLKAHDIYW